MADSPLAAVLGPVVGGAGLAYTLGKGESPLPSQFDVVQNTYAPTQFAQGQSEFAQGQQLVGQGTQGFKMAQAGQLTGPQAAQLQQIRESLSNQAAQTYYGMGRDPTHDTSFIGTQADIDAKVAAMSQQFIQSTIALAGAELSGGHSLETGGAAAESAATNAIMAVGQAQLQDDKDYADAVSAAFGAFTKSFGGGGTTIKMG